ncbi:MAG: hypothetical protein ACE5FY_02175 [Nitrospiria bacterium]
MFFRLDRISEESPLSKILFYSVVLHYIMLFALFGNPFFITFDQQPYKPASRNTFDVDLLTPPPPGASSKKISARLFPRENLAVTETLAVRKEQGNLTKISTAATKDSQPSDERITDIAPLLPEQIPSKPIIPKRVVRKLPPNMTGPEDCLLKVVAMVCPNGEFDCITAYKDFCTTLPD